MAVFRLKGFVLLCCVFTLPTNKIFPHFTVEQSGQHSLDSPASCLMPCELCPLSLSNSTTLMKLEVLGNSPGWLLCPILFLIGICRSGENLSHFDSHCARATWRPTGKRKFAKEPRAMGGNAWVRKWEPIRLWTLESELILNPSPVLSGWLLYLCNPWSLHF